MWNGEVMKMVYERWSAMGGAAANVSLGLVFDIL